MAAPSPNQSRLRAVLLGLGAAFGLQMPLGAQPAPKCRTYKLQFTDAATHRPIPVRVYAPMGRGPEGLKIALLNHGYGIRNKRYAFVARNLVAHGYLVLSLQQTLASDALLPTTGDPYTVRRPYWERGVHSMLVVLKDLPRRYPALDTLHTLLVGHSYGGDMVALFAQEHPRRVQKVISLDNCRMPLPRQAAPQLLSLRSSDQTADPGVVPTPAEQAAFHIRIVQLPATPHGSMCDAATATQQQEMNQYISAFLAE